MRSCDGECVPSFCAVSEVYHCSGNGSWVNKVLGTELPKCVAGNQGLDLERERVLRCAHRAHLLKGVVILLGRDLMVWACQSLAQ